jgi:L-threonylcarbamoyladenylate synthase
MTNEDNEQLKNGFEQGEVFAYPTEAVYGLGCDPDNESAVMSLLKLNFDCRYLLSAVALRR